MLHFYNLWNHELVLDYNKIYISKMIYDNDKIKHFISIEYNKYNRSVECYIEKMDNNYKDLKYLLLSYLENKLYNLAYNYYDTGYTNEEIYEKLLNFIQTEFYSDTIENFNFQLNDKSTSQLNNNLISQLINQLVDKLLSDKTYILYSKDKQLNIILDSLINHFLFKIRTFNHIEAKLLMPEITMRNKNLITKYMNEIEIIKLIIDISNLLSTAIHPYHIYRDMKPDNILKKNNNYILIDYAMIIQSSLICECSTCIGTEGYDAPEIINNHMYDRSIDIWSFGITLLELILGKELRLIFKYEYLSGGYNLILLDKNLNKKVYKKIMESNHEHKKFFAELVSNMLHKKPTYRNRASEIYDLTQKYYCKLTDNSYKEYVRGCPSTYYNNFYFSNKYVLDRLNGNIYEYDKFGHKKILTIENGEDKIVLDNSFIEKNHKFDRLNKILFTPFKRYIWKEIKLKSNDKYSDNGYKIVLLYINNINQFLDIIVSKYISQYISQDQLNKQLNKQLDKQLDNKLNLNLNLKLTSNRQIKKNNKNIKKIKYNTNFYYRLISYLSSIDNFYNSFNNKLIETLDNKLIDQPITNILLKNISFELVKIINSNCRIFEYIISEIKENIEYNYRKYFIKKTNLLKNINKLYDIYMNSQNNDIIDQILHYDLYKLYDNIIYTLFMIKTLYQKYNDMNEKRIAIIFSIYFLRIYFDISHKEKLTDETEIKLLFIITNEFFYV